MSDLYVLVTWQYSGIDQSGYQLNRSTNSGSTWPDTFTFSETTTQYIDTNVTASASYTYEVAPFNDYGMGAFSNTASVIIE